MEKHLNKRLRQLIDQAEDRPLLYRRIEDASGNLGTFDVHVIIEGRAIWIELKETETPGAKPDMRRGQPAFGRRAQRAGAAASVLVANKRDATIRIIEGCTTGDDWRALMLYEGELDHTAWSILIGEHNAIRERTERKSNRTTQAD